MRAPCSLTSRPRLASGPGRVGVTLPLSIRTASTRRTRIHTRGLERTLSPGRMLQGISGSSADLAKTAPEPWDSSTTYGSTRVARGLSSRAPVWLIRLASMALQELHQARTHPEDAKRRLAGRIPLEICGSSGEKAKMETTLQRPTEFWTIFGYTTSLPSSGLS